MAYKPTDKTYFTINTLTDGIVIHQRNPKNETEIRSTELDKYEVNMLLDSLLELPDYQERATSWLIGKNIVRPNNQI